eukprot:2735582-Alexandrium_andersonii.AAC.1
MSVSVSVRVAHPPMCSSIATHMAVGKRMFAPPCHVALGLGSKCKVDGLGAQARPPIVRPPQRSHRAR